MFTAGSVAVSDILFAKNGHHRADPRSKSIPFWVATLDIMEATFYFQK